VRPYPHWPVTSEYFPDWDEFSRVQVVPDACGSVVLAVDRQPLARADWNPEVLLRHANALLWWMIDEGA
jgi:hypothetical protein